MMNIGMHGLYKSILADYMFFLLSIYLGSIPLVSKVWMICGNGLVQYCLASFALHALIGLCWNGSRLGCICRMYGVEYGGRT